MLENLNLFFCCFFFFIVGFLYLYYNPPINCRAILLATLRHVVQVTGRISRNNLRLLCYALFRITKKLYDFCWDIYTGIFSAENFILFPFFFFFFYQILKFLKIYKKKYTIETKIMNINQREKKFL